MKARATYPVSRRTRTPHPSSYLRRLLGQVSDFCPSAGRGLVWGVGEIPISDQRDSSRSGRLGRAGQKSQGYACAREIRGLGGDFLVCRLCLFALSAPRAPPSLFVFLFQRVTGFRFTVGFCPVKVRSALSAPFNHLEINILVTSS